MVEIDTSSSSMSTELTLGLGLVSTSEMCGTKVGLFEAIHHESEISTTATKPEIQVVGWPPVRLQRKKEVVIKKSWSKYVKVAVDGVPYLRKVDLEMYTSYDHLLSALPLLFTMCNFPNEGKLMDPTINVVEYLPTYEDNDGDWMLLGDVPWKMFVESCKRLRLMKISEATGFAPRTSLLL